MNKNIMLKTILLVCMCALFAKTYAYSITVTNASACSKKIEVTADETVDSIENKIKAAYNLQEDISLTYNGEKLDGFKKLDTYKIYNGSIVTFNSSYTTHNFSEYKLEREASCKEPGRMVRVCSVCGKKEYQEIQKKEHSFGDYSVTILATCSKTGLKQRTCKVCKLVEEEVIPRYNHKFSKWAVTKEPTCTQDGQMQRKCAYCGKVEICKTAKLGHDIQEERIDATCTEAGANIRKCSRENCTYIESKVEIPKLGHNMSAWEVKESATLVGEGKQIRYCQNIGCNHTEEKSVASLVTGGENSELVNAIVEEITKPQNSKKVAILAFAMLSPVVFVFLRDLYISWRNKVEEEKEKEKEEK